MASESDKPATNAESADESPAAPKAGPAKKPSEPKAVASAPKPAAPAEPAEGKRSMGPVLIGGALILAVFAAIAFWPGKSSKSGGAGDKSAAAEGDGEPGRMGGAGKGGVQARDYDEPSAPDRPGRRNPAVRLPNVGISPEAPAPPDDTPPTFTSKAEEIAWYERKLEQAKEIRDARQKFAERLPKVKEKIQQSPNAEAQMQAFEQRKKIVEDNFAKAEADVADLEKKLAQLRGG